MSEATEATNQAADEPIIDAGVAEGVDAQGDNLDTSDLDAAGDGQADEVEDLEDYELDGKTYKLPKTVIPQIMKNADYTRKTQEAAELRRSLETKAQALVQQEQVSQALLEDRVKVHSLAQQVEAYRNADWDAIEAADAANGTNDYTRHWRTYERLKEQLTGAETELKGKETSRLEGQRQQVVADFQETMKVLRDPVNGIPGWSPETVTKIEQYVAKEFGLTTEDLVTTTDVRAWKVLHRLHIAEAELATLRKTQRHAASQTTQPAGQVRGQGGKFTVSPDTSDFAAFEKQYGSLAT